ncbi:MAG: phage tail protein [Spirochaetota bacterium]
MAFTLSTAHFSLEIDGIDCSEVREVRGFALYSADSERARSAYDRTFTTELTIVRRWTDTDFVSWLQEMKSGERALKNGRLSFITPDGEVIVSFRLERIFPIEWHGPAIRSGDAWAGSETATEEVLLAVEAISEE